MRSLRQPIFRLVFGAAWWSPMICGSLSVVMSDRNAQSTLSQVLRIFRRVPAAWVVAVLVEMPNQALNRVEYISVLHGGSRSLLVIAVTGASVFVAMRTVLAIPLAVESRSPPFRALALSWKFTRHSHARLLLVGAGGVIPTMLVSLATRHSPVARAFAFVPLGTVLMLIWAQLYRVLLPNGPSGLSGLHRPPRVAR